MFFGLILLLRYLFLIYEDDKIFCWIGLTPSLRIILCGDKSEDVNSSEEVAII